MISDGLVKSHPDATYSKIEGGVKPFDPLVSFNTCCFEHPIFPKVDASELFTG